MELSREVYQLIVRHVGNRSDLCSLARVSKAFQRAAEPSLYNTLLMRDPRQTVKLCSILSSQDRLAILVEALTVFALAREDREDEEEDVEGKGSEEDDIWLPEDFWVSLAAALRHLSHLRFFNIHIDGESTRAWILRGCEFQLRAFHSDFAWDSDLVEFLNSQSVLMDLYLADYTANLPGIRQGEEEEEDNAVPTPTTSTIHPHSLSKLSAIECSFTDAMAALVPGRPVTRIKTCFSREDTSGKTSELSQLLAALQRSTGPLRSLDLADSSYTEEFSLAVLREIVPRLPNLRYLGTLVLPIGLEVRVM